MRCSNNLKNLGLGLHHFENTYGKFPPGQVTGPFPEAGVMNVVNHGWGPHPASIQALKFATHSSLPRLPWRHLATAHLIVDGLGVCPDALAVG
jgi:hypothetical protein